MGFLERLGLSRKPRRRLGAFELQRRSPSAGRELSREDVLARVGIFGVLLVLTMLMFPQAETYEVGSRVREGDVWQREEVIAPFSFPVLKSEAQLQAERDSVRFEEPPVFARVPDAQARTRTRLDSVGVRIERVLGAYVEWQRSRGAGEAAAARADSVRYVELRARSDLPFEGQDWEALVRSFAARAGVVTPDPPAAPPTGPPLHDVVLAEAARIADRLLPLGVLDVPKDSVLTPQITVVDLAERTEGALMRTNVYGLNEAITVARNEFAVRYPDRSDAVAIGVLVFERALQPSLVFQEDETEARWAEREARISRNVGLVQEGEAIVRRGDYITEETQRRLESLARMRAEHQGGIGPWRFFLGQLILSVGGFLMFFLYLFLLRRQIYDETRYVLLIAILFALIIGFFGVVVRLPTAPSLAVPVALGSILLTAIFDSRVGMFATVTLACLGGVIFGYDFEFAFATMVAGMLAVFSMRDVKNRGQILATALIVFLAYAFMLGGYTLLRASGLTRFLQELLLVGINAGLLLLAYPFLLLFERGFGVTTDLTLLELSDTNRPLLKELSTRAPGTFNHAIQVANLAEAAADAIGANALQARVGALYHDIGKMIRPEYFIENQQPGENPHDRITPYMSALIIAEHVKAGEELGREHNLPEAVLSFIPSHHGTTLMEYFYRKAKEEGGEAAVVDESEFRYPGPRPLSNEQGIVMLADSVEAASRSLDKPTPKRIEGLIDAIFKARIEDGQLAQTALTFSDLDRIRETFLSILNGVYHFRVKYPGQDSGDAAPEGEPAPPVPAAPLAAPLGEEPREAGLVEQEPPPAGPSDEERATLG
jgi:cyclic-di-AMP phosphodiesterase PgpH